MNADGRWRPRLGRGPRATCRAGTHVPAGDHNPHQATAARTNHLWHSSVPAGAGTIRSHYEAVGPDDRPLACWLVSWVAGGWKVAHRRDACTRADRISGQQDQAKRRILDATQPDDSLGTKGSRADGVGDDDQEDGDGG